MRLVQFGVLNGYDVLYLLRVNAENPISIISEVGKRVPAHATGLGKALLSLKTDEWLEEKYRDHHFEKIGPKCITSFDELMAAIREVRKNGFAYDKEEASEGVSCTAVPIYLEGSIQGALSVTAPKYRLNERKQNLIEKCLIRSKSLIEEIARIQGLHLQG